MFGCLWCPSPAHHCWLCSTAVGLGFFGGFITLALPITTGYEWRSLALFYWASVCGNEEADEPH